MAVAFGSGLANGYDTTALSSYTTASQTPTANRIVLAAIVTTDTSERPERPSLSGNSLTWVPLETFVYANSGTNRYRISAFAALTGSSPTAGTVSITTSTNQSMCAWSFAEFSGTHLTSVSDAIRQIRYGQAPASHRSSEVHLAAMQDADCAVWGGMGKFGTEVVSPAGGYTEIHEVAHLTPDGQLQTQYLLGGSRLCETTWTTTDRQTGAIAVELRAATSPIDFRPADLKMRQNKRREFKTAVISINTAADNLILTATANKQIYVYGLTLFSEGTVTVMWEMPTVDYAPIPLQAGEGYRQWVDPPGFIMFPLRDTTLECNLSAAVNVRGWIAYWEEDI